MEYQSVSWSAAEPFNAAKVKQMADNDEVIQNLFLKTALGTISQDVYIDRVGGSSITAAPGAWTDIIVLSDVFFYPSRWIKIAVIANGAKSVDRGTYIPFRVLMDGTEILYMRTPDADVNGTQKWSSCSGARIIQSTPGLHDFQFQIGNDYVSASNNTSIRPIGANNPTTISVDDIGGTNV